MVCIFYDIKQIQKSINSGIIIFLVDLVYREPFFYMKTDGCV
ncbi:hypothetical protein ABID42_003165 [Arcicella rosea]